MEMHAGNTADAVHLHGEAIWKCREAGDRRSEGITLTNLAVLAVQQNRNADARHLFSEALELHRESRDRPSEGLTLANLGQLHLEEGCVEEAEALFEQALALATEVGDPVELAKVHVAWGHLHLARGESASAALASARRLEESGAYTLGPIVDALQRAITDADTGQPLHRGARLADLPEGLRTAAAGTRTKQRSPRDVRGERPRDLTIRRRPRRPAVSPLPLPLLGTTP